jgi:hypothetical protein
MGFFSYVLGYDVVEDVEADPKSKRQKYLICEQIKKSKNIKLKSIKKHNARKKQKKVTWNIK